MATSERLFLDEGGIRVSQAQFTVPSQTYLMGDVTSATALEKNPPKLWPYLLIALGGVAALAGLSPSIGIPFGGPLGGLVVLALGLVWLFRMKPLFYVVLQTPSGETRALASKNRMQAHQIVDALNKAVAARNSSR